MTTVLYFAALRERVNLAREELQLPEQARCVADVVELLRARGGQWAEAFAAGATWRAAVNQNMARPETPVKTGDEIAFFPPVTGG